MLYQNNCVPLCKQRVRFMPRQARKTSGPGIYHVMLRGINRQDIFEDADDYMQFLKSLSNLVNAYDEQGCSIPAPCKFYAYCLMPNHAQSCPPPRPGKHGADSGNSQAYHDILCISFQQEEWIEWFCLWANGWWRGNTGNGWRATPFCLWQFHQGNTERTVWNSKHHRRSEFRQTRKEQNNKGIMQSRSRIQTTCQNNWHQFWDYSKSSNRSENRPLIYWFPAS